MNKQTNKKSPSLMEELHADKHQSSGCLILNIFI